MYIFVQLLDMECELVKLDKLSNTGATIYSLLINEENKTLFDLFIEQNNKNHKIEVKDIVARLSSIGKIGAKEEFFKTQEGNPGDGVCALYDNPNSNLRLYCIRYGNDIVILGNGGFKPKTTRRLQETPELKEANYFLREVSKVITERLKERDISINNNYFEGDFIFNFNDYDN